MTDGGRPSSEFLSEAQEIIESFSRNLLALDAQSSAPELDPELLNSAFRAVHTLKGLAALFGAGSITELSHALESALDGLRLGRIQVDRDSLDVLFESVETFQALLAGLGRDGPAVEIRGLLERIGELTEEQGHDRPDTTLVGLDPSVLGVLTEYEEHRLRETIRLGRRLFRVHASFSLIAIDVGIEAIKGKLKTFGEVITYLPSADASADDRIDLDILLGSEAELDAIASGVAGDGAAVFELNPLPDSTGAPGSKTSDPKGKDKPSRPSGGASRSSGTAGASRPAGTSRAATADGASRAAGAEGSRSSSPATRSASVEDRVGDDTSFPPHGGGRVETEEGGTTELSLRSLSRTVRVDLSRLDSLMNLIGELAVVQANFASTLDDLRAQPGTADVAREFQAHLRTMDRKLSLLQQGVLEVRMVPLGQVFDKLARVVRRLGREADKEIRLNISGAETELDKLIVEELSDPLMHMIRNAVDHGIESREERMSAGKSAVGTIELRAFQKGNRVVIEVEDDGRGLDWRQIRRTAVRRGLVTDLESRELGMQQVVDFIFAPGFTTRETATATSGRGVGMDVVKTNISRLSGMIDVDTVLGKGTKFAITLPVTLAIIQALVIETAGHTFCIPLNSVLESIMVHRRQIHTVEGHEVISLREKTLPLLHVSRLFDLRRPSENHEREVEQRIYVVIVGLAQHKVGLVVDELLGQQDVVIKPLGRALRSVPGIAGATEISGGRTVLLLDVSTLVEEALAKPDAPPGRSGFGRDGSTREGSSRPFGSEGPSHAH